MILPIINVKKQSPLPASRGGGRVLLKAVFTAKTSEASPLSPIASNSAVVKELPSIDAGDVDLENANKQGVIMGHSDCVDSVSVFF